MAAYQIFFVLLACLKRSYTGTLYNNVKDYDYEINYFGNSGAHHSIYA
jgi:hypothetical protein